MQSIASYFLLPKTQSNALNFRKPWSLGHVLIDMLKVEEPIRLLSNAPPTTPNISTMDTNGDGGTQGSTDIIEGSDTSSLKISSKHGESEDVTAPQQADLNANINSNNQEMAVGNNENGPSPDQEDAGGQKVENVISSESVDTSQVSSITGMPSIPDNQSPPENDSNEQAVAPSASIMQSSSDNSVTHLSENSGVENVELRSTDNNIEVSSPSNPEFESVSGMAGSAVAYQENIESEENVSYHGGENPGEHVATVYESDITMQSEIISQSELPQSSDTSEVISQEVHEGVQDVESAVQPEVLHPEETVIVQSEMTTDDLNGSELTQTIEQPGLTTQIVMQGEDGQIIYQEDQEIPGVEHHIEEHDGTTPTVMVATEEGGQYEIRMLTGGELGDLPEGTQLMTEDGQLIQAVHQNEDGTMLVLAGEHPIQLDENGQPIESIITEGTEGAIISSGETVVTSDGSIVTNTVSEGLSYDSQQGVQIEQPPEMIMLGEDAGYIVTEGESGEEFIVGEAPTLEVIFFYTFTA